ncbi:MAG: DUF1501 domain-containing protein, partial [Planctomycetaceae bacterium]|nr:DUF1501 domain-containing protein [Planctomycetaceae bacterium]
MSRQPQNASHVSRRQALVTAGAAGLTGLTLTNLLREESRATGRGRPDKQATSLILLWMRGGPSQHETWDPKPDAPVEFRGAFGSRSTSVPGTQIVDMLPQCAAIQHKWSIIRSLHHSNAGHSAGDQIVFTGYPPGSDPNINVHPSCGAITSQQLGHLNPELPAYVMI